MYRPSALAISGLFADLPFSFLRVLIFSLIIYFMSGLVSAAGTFFTFFIVIYVTFLALSALFKIFGTVCRSYDLAARLVSTLRFYVLMMTR